MKRNLISLLVGIALFTNVTVAAQVDGILQECLCYLNPLSWSNTTKACALGLVAVGVGTYFYYFNGSLMPVESASCPVNVDNKFFYQIHSDFEQEKNTYRMAEGDYSGFTFLCKQAYEKIYACGHGIVAHTQEILKEVSKEMPNCVCVDSKFGGILENATHFFCTHKIDACQCSYYFAHEIPKEMVKIIRPNPNQ